MKLLTAILLLVGISALGGALGLLSAQSLPIAPELQKLDPTLTLLIIRILSLAYAISALLAALCAWRRSVWALRIYVVFAGSAALLLLSFLYIAPVPKDAFFYIGGPIFIGLVVWGLWKGRAVLHSNIKTAQRAA